MIISFILNPLLTFYLILMKSISNSIANFWITHQQTGLSKPKMPVAKFELPVAKYFYRLPPGGVLMVQILSTRGHLVHSLHTRWS